MRQSIGEDTLGKPDDLPVEQKPADAGENGVVSVSRLLGFRGALFIPEKCVPSGLREPDGCSDTHFILYDGAWLRLEAAPLPGTVRRAQPVIASACFPKAA